MAKILLNVELESKTFQTQLQKIKEQLDQTFIGGDGVKGIGGVKAAKAQVESLQKSFANLLNTLKGSESKYAPDTFKQLKEQITNALNATKALNKELGDGKPTDEQRKEYARLNKQLSTLSSSFATVRVESEKLQKENKLAIPNVDNLRKKYANLLNTIQSQEKYYKKGTFSSLTSEVKANLTSLQQLDPTTADYAVRVNELDKQLNRLSAQFAETRASSENMHGSFMEIVKGFAKFQLSAMVVMKPLQMIRNSWADLNETLVETEDAIVALRRVAGDEANANELYDLAQRYGQTFENVSELATNFARAGYEWNETIKATEAALLALNTAELDATEASDGMIAILQQFDYEASELEKIIDKLNITADNAAVSTDGLLKALSRTGSSAKNAKLSLEETVAVVTALSEATGRSGENIGTALNSLIQFSTKASALDTFSKLGGDVEKTVELYRQGGATVLDIWEELSKVISSNQTAESILGENFTTEEFESLNEELKQALGENFAQTTEIYDTASTFRKNYFIALLQNLDQVQESLDTMNKAQGYSQKENAQYIDTYTAKVNALEAKWQDIANDEQGLLGIKKTLVDMASGLLDIIQRIGGLKGVLQTVIAVASPFLVKWTLAFGAKALTSAINGVATLFSAIKTGALSANAALGAIGIIAGVITTIVNAVKASKEIDLADIPSASRSVADIEQNLENITKEYEDLESSIKKYREILADTTSTEKEKEEALKGLNDIQNTLKDDTNEYASSLDLVNGKLDDQIEKLQQLSFLERKRAVQDFVDKNIDAISDARTYLTETSNMIDFSDSYGLYSGDSEFSKWLQENGYAEDATGGWNDFWEDFGEGFTGTFGGKISTDIVTDKMTMEQQIAFLEEMFAKAGEISNKEKRERIQGIIRKAIRGIEENQTFVSSSNLIHGNEKGATLFEKLSQDQREKLLKTNTQEEWDKLLKEWGFLKEENQSGGSGSTENKTNLSDVVNKLEAIRENTEKTKELEEKQLALQEARNQRTVRVFNAETGQWEMQANEKDIAEAEEAAKDSLLDYLKTDEAQKKFDEGAFTLPQWILDKIAEPTSDEQFKAAMSLMGILSGAVNKTPMSSGAVYNNSATTNNNNSNTYNYNGIPISSEMANNYTVAQLAEMFGQME